MIPAPVDTEPTEHRLVSVIVPCFNESATVREAIYSLHRVLEEAGEPHELVFVDDGSRDNTIEILRSIESEIAYLKVVELRRNFGQTIAYQAGIDEASGSYHVLFSGDLEIPADAILQVIQALDEGADFVNTSRKDRWGGSHALKSKIANRILNKISNLRIQDRGSGLKGMRREIADRLLLYGEWHRFLPDLASIHTSRIVEFDVPFEERKAGVSSYKGKLKSISVFLDLATVAFTIHCNCKPYLLLPGRLLGFSGVVIGIIGFSITGWLVLQKLLIGISLSERPLFLVSILTTILGFIMVMIGILGELMMQVAIKIESGSSRNIRRSPATKEDR